jgi:hypothetical protein
MSNPNPKLLRHTPAPKDSCLCGSGKTFGICCTGRIGGYDTGVAYRKAVDAGNYAAALLEARADIARYTIWHRTNTRPILQVPRALENEAPLNMIVDIDHNAIFTDIAMYVTPHVGP